MQQHYGLQVNLLSLKEAKVETTEDGRRIVTIDVTNAPTYLHDVPDNGAVYLNMVAFEQRQPSRYGDTHIIKPKLMPGEPMPDGSHPPVMGNMKPYRADTRKDAWKQAQARLRERERKDFY